MMQRDVVAEVFARIGRAKVDYGDEWRQQKPKERAKPVSERDVEKSETAYHDMKSLCFCRQCGTIMREIQEHAGENVVVFDDGKMTGKLCYCPDCGSVRVQFNQKADTCKEEQL